MLVAATLVLAPLSATDAVVPSTLHARVQPRSVQPLDTSDYLSERPTAAELPEQACADTDPVCVHWTTTGRDAATQAQAALTLQKVIDVYDAYAGAGFRMPEVDCDDVTVSCGSAGGSPAIDIYLADIGNASTMGGSSYYGFCLPTDSVGQRPAGARDDSAYCVLDNDYSADEFCPDSGSCTSPLHDLEVTVAHEFFHAIQFGYDSRQATWFMEATATWAESTLYPKIGDNRQFLPFGPLCFPGLPLNANGASKPFPVTTCAGLRIGLADYNWAHVYGDWIFFRWLTDYVKASDGTAPLETMREIWSATDTTGGEHTLATRAIGGALKSHHLTWGKAYALFSAANLRSRQTYTGAGHKSYPVAKPTARVTLGPKKRSATATFSLQHLASATQRVTVGSAGKRDALRLTFANASASVLTVHFKNGRILETPMSGKNTAEVAAAKRVKYVDLTLANGKASGTRQATLTVALKRLKSAG